MPVHFHGTVEQRIAYLDSRNLRCDAHGRCPNRANTEFSLIPLDGLGQPTDNAPQVRRSCGRHRLVFDKGGLWRVLDKKPIDAPKPTQLDLAFSHEEADTQPRSIAHNANARTGVALGELRDV